MRTVSHDIPDPFEPGDSLLVLAPSFATSGPKTCSDLLAREEGVESHVLCVTFTRTPEDHLVNWRRHGNLPERASFVDVDASARSMEAFQRSGEEIGQDDVDVTVTQISSPENLTRLGVRVTECLEELTENVGDRQVVVCFDSVTAMLQYVELDQAFRFLHVVTDRFADADAMAHFHVDPGAHDDETLETLRSLFDGVWAFEDEA
jgi:hypothetical protein